MSSEAARVEFPLRRACNVHRGYGCIGQESVANRSNRLLFRFRFLWSSSHFRELAYFSGSMGDRLLASTHGGPDRQTLWGSGLIDDRRERNDGARRRRWSQTPGSRGAWARWGAEQFLVPEF